MRTAHEPLCYATSFVTWWYQRDSNSHLRPYEGRVLTVILWYCVGCRDGIRTTRFPAYETGEDGLSSTLLCKNFPLSSVLDSIRCSGLALRGLRQRLGIQCLEGYTTRCSIGICTYLWGPNHLQSLEGRLLLAPSNAKDLSGSREHGVDATCPR